MKRAAPEPEGGHLQNGVKPQAVEHGYPSETGNSEEDERSRAMRRSTRPKTTPRRALTRGEQLPVLYYKEGERLSELASFVREGSEQLVEVRIPAASLTNTNRQVRARQLWGNEIYTQDSDLVAVLMHLGYYNHVLAAPPVNALEIRAVIQPLPPQKAYSSCPRNSIRSRAWGTASEGCSYRVERCILVSKNGMHSDLEPTPDGAATVVPTFAPAQHERALNTRSASAAHDRRARTMQEITLQYNLCNEPWLKYTMTAVSDRGLKPSQWASARLHSEVLYLETHRQRYELSRVDTSASSGTDANSQGETYRWALCKEPLPLVEMRHVGIPLPAKHVEVLHSSLAWEDLQWCNIGVILKGKALPFARMHWTARCQPRGEAP
ncbi:g2940 [Coccomyxa viridis]|uniref:G2940 protein n=1 Tax=Coccomyxa viridis TaxID=1274662 RepID=A0ABP1FLM2_9CHLO